MLRATTGGRCFTQAVLRVRWMLNVMGLPSGVCLTRLPHVWILIISVVAGPAGTASPGVLAFSVIAPRLTSLSCHLRLNYPPHLALTQSSLLSLCLSPFLSSLVPSSRPPDGYRFTSSWMAFAKRIR